MQFGLSFIAIFMTHSLIAVAFTFGVAAMVALSLILGTLTWRRFVGLTLASSVTGLLGNLQFLYGWTTFKQDAEGYFSKWISVYQAQVLNLDLLISTGLGLLFLVGGLLLARGKATKLLWSFFGLYLLILVFLGSMFNFGLVYLIPPDRVAHYRMLILSSVLAAVYYVAILRPFLSRRYARGWLSNALACAFLLALGWFGLPKEVPSPPTYEYNSLARISYQIKRSFPPLDWTIVSTVEDYSKVLNDRGWHLNIQELLLTHSPYETPIAIPTRYVFVFVEKNPFPRSSFSGLNEPGVRADLQRRLQEWANVYRLFHTDMSIYYEDWDVIVYMIDKNVSAGSRSAPETPRAPLAGMRPAGL
jgi:hypothetical protein